MVLFKDRTSLPGGGLIPHNSIHYLHRLGCENLFNQSVNQNYIQPISEPELQVIIIWLTGDVDTK